MYLIFEEGRKNITVELSKEAYNEPSKYITSNIDINSENKFKREIFGKQKFIIHTNTMDAERIKMAFEKWYRGRNP